MLLHGGHAATDLVCSVVDPQEWHYSSPVLTALYSAETSLALWLERLGRKLEASYNLTDLSRSARCL